MGIKCSLLGHSFTGTSVEEEREEQGSEVVITIKEVETCDRCGKTRVVSENKEVRSIESATAVEDTGPGSSPDPEPTPDEPTGTPAGGPSPSPDIDAAEDDAELIEEAESAEPDATEPDATEAAPDPGPDTAEAAGGAEEIETSPSTTGPDTTPDADTGGADAAEGHDDDAVILDDEDDEQEREPGEWPEETRREDPGEAVDAGDTAEWPDEDGGDDDAWEPSESLTREIDETEVKPAGSATITVPEGEFECAECGFRTDVEASSLRAGDFCPECKTGTLEHRSGE
jgi:hypothetical protein